MESNHKICRHCCDKLDYVMINLGKTPPSNSYITKNKLNEPEKIYPLIVYICNNCFLAQVPEFKSNKEIFDSEYAYFSSYSESWLNHSYEFVEYIINELCLNNESYIIEIASNDGYLLKNFVEKKIPCLGIEPTLNTAQVAQKKGVDTLVDFFTYELSKKLQKSDLIICNNVLAHVPNINDFVRGLKNTLKPNGTITIEFPHLLNLIQKLQFDTIYHEHYSYLSLYTTKIIFEKYGLNIYKAEKLSTHGGSLRLFIKHSKNENLKIHSSVSKILDLELNYGLNKLENYDSFKNEVFRIKQKALEFLYKKKSENKKIIAYGAAAKGNTFLNYCGIGNELIDFVVDKSNHKQGKYLPYNNIPILNETMINEYKPDYVIIFPWNLKEEIIKQLDYVRSWGCSFVCFIPNLRIYN